ncbi:MAG: VOC family protein [Candidatus Dojkabacteria bacterium]
MFKGIYTLIWSEDPDELVKFYTDVLELEVNEKVDIPAKDGLEADYGYELVSGKTPIVWIGKHSGVKGKSKESLRIMHNLRTDNVQKWFEKVEKAGVKILQKPILTPFSSEDNPVYVCTFLDPDGNSWQFMGKLGN